MATARSIRSTASRSGYRLARQPAGLTHIETTLHDEPETNTSNQEQDRITPIPAIMLDTENQTRETETHDAQETETRTRDHCRNLPLCGDRLAVFAVLRADRTR